MEPTNKPALRLVPHAEYGADSVSTRENTPYQFAEAFERALVYLVCVHKRFFDAVGTYFEAKLLSGRTPSLLMEAAQLTYAKLGHPPQDRDLVMETIATLIRDGRATHEEMAACKDYLDCAEDLGVPAWEDVRTAAIPTLARRLELEILRESRDSYSKRTGQKQLQRLLKKMERLHSSIEESWGVELGETVVQLIEEFRTLEKLPTGIPMIDDQMGKNGGGLLRGTSTAMIGATGTAKSMFLTMVAASATVMGHNVCFATLELPVFYQHARYLACLTGLTINEVMANPRYAIGLSRSMYPKLGKIRINSFNKTPYLQTVFEWEDREQDALKEPIEVRLLDYFSIVELLDERGQPSHGKGGHRDLSEAAKIYMTRAQDDKLWHVTAAAPTRDEDKPKKRDEQGRIPFTSNSDVGGAYGIPKALDTILVTMKVLLGDGQDLNNYDLIPACTKDRYGVSEKSAWVGEPMYHDFARGRICGTPSFVAKQNKDPYEAF